MKAAIAIAVEVDGPSPSHFIVKARSPTGSTTLKRRQVPSIHGIELVSVPHIGTFFKLALLRLAR